MKDLLDVDVLTGEDIFQILDMADGMREVLTRPIRRTPALRGKTLVNLFYEPSTRTRVAFEVAAKNLSADVINVAASGSSVEKGESLLDTARTLEALGADFIVMRHPCSGAPYLVARHVRASVINAGDGWHAHPTQALLDLYTIRARLGRIAGLRVVIVGDVWHSRVARSNAWGLTKLGASVVLCGPPTLLPPPSAIAVDEGLLPPVELDECLDRAIADADVVMALRLQHERLSGGELPSLREYVRLYQVNATRLRKARPGALLMHPGPRNTGVEVAEDVALGEQSVIEEQVTNGVAVRMALLYRLAQVRGTVDS